MKRLLLVFVFLVLGLFAAVFGYVGAVSSLALPQTEGQAKLPGLSASVSITRDARGVPWIKADNAADAYMALGYVHAQDRLFQMELMRRLGQGRLAEVLGNLGVGSDKFMRTLGLYARTQENLISLDAETKIAVDAYAKGVNAFMAANGLPLEYKLLFFSPEPWTPADSLVWQKLMGLQLSGNWPEELSRAAIIAKLGPEKATELWPDVDAASPVTVVASPAFLTKLRTAMLNVVRPSLASNIWAVAPSRTATGGALLANDPHLNFQAPNMWYLAGLSYPGVDLVGATVPGVPFHLLGHNGSLAWGFTTTHGDTQDLFVETLAGEGYATPDGPAPFTTRDETIRVRFGETLTLKVRETRHGPVISDILPAEDLRAVPGKAVALSATLLAPGDRSIDAIYKMGRSKTTQDFREAAKLFHAPQQNVMFADTQGSIGYIAVGRVPLRKSTLCDGLLPADGARGDCDWMGWAAFNDQPQKLDPPDGVLINANNKNVPDDYPLLIAKEWPEGYRARRIEEFLAGRSGLTLKDMDTLQHDAVSLMARDMLAVLLPLLKDDDLKPTLAAWDGTMGLDRTEPLIFALWMERLKARLLEDELGEEFSEFRGARPTLLTAILTKNTAWCDDVRTPAPEACEAQVNAAWSDALAWLRDNAGDDDRNWRWGEWHIASFSHPVFGNIPGLSGLGGFAAPTPGDDATVNRGSFSGSTSRIPFRHRHGPGVRAIYDLADLRRSQFSMAGGQSAHLLSGHLDDLMVGWAGAESFALTPPEKGTGQLLILNN
jgi:penicillin amidase